MEKIFEELFISILCMVITPSIWEEMEVCLWFQTSRPDFLNVFILSPISLPTTWLVISLVKASHICMFSMADASDITVKDSEGLDFTLFSN